MPCDTRLREGQTLVDRMAEVDRALRALQAALGTGIAKVKIAPNGAVAFDGWIAEERSGLSDACAYRALAIQGSWQLRQAVARVEAISGRKVNAQAVAAGWHTHDGETWSKH